MLALLKGVVSFRDIRRASGVGRIVRVPCALGESRYLMDSFLVYLRWSRFDPFHRLKPPLLSTILVVDEIKAPERREKPRIEPGESAKQNAAAEKRERVYLGGPQSRLFEATHAIRILREYWMGLRNLHFTGPCVTVFGSARIGEGSEAYALGMLVGEELAKRGITVMTGGGPGLMESAARGAKLVGGTTIGCNIALPREQAANAYLDKCLTFHHFFIRKVMLVKYSFGFIALPGGFGTMDEVFEAATLIQTAKISSFPVVLMGNKFWKPIIEALGEKFIEYGTIQSKNLSIFKIYDDPKEAVSYILSTASPAKRKPNKLHPKWWLGEFARWRSREKKNFK